MALINLRAYYPFYEYDLLVEVSDELAVQLQQWERDEKNQQRKRRRYKDCYTLDCNDGMKGKAIFVALSPDELYERKVTREQLHAAISVLPDKQAKRIYAHCVVGMSKAKIAAAEKVSHAAVSVSIVRGLKRMAIYLKKNL